VDRFRRSTEPDFVAAAIAGDDTTRVFRAIIESSIGWLAPAVAAEPDVTIRRLPLGCVCHMLMMGRLAEAEPSDKGATEALIRLIDPLKRVVARALCPPVGEGEGEGDEEEEAERAATQGADTLKFFFEELRCSSSQRRGAARRALEDLLMDVHPGEGPAAMEVEEVTGTAGARVLALVRTGAYLVRRGDARLSLGVITGGTGSCTVAVRVVLLLVRLT
jgi:hypothetical protein